jgi:hypothetical protein
MHESTQAARMQGFQRQNRSSQYSLKKELAIYGLAH